MRRNKNISYLIVPHIRFLFLCLLIFDMFTVVELKYLKATH